MQRTHFILMLIAILFFGVAQAQPDQNYIQDLTGEIDQDWLISTGNSIPAQSLNWSLKKAPNFQDIPKHARKQADLSEGWNFFPVNLNGKMSDGKKIEMPHDFEKDRDYFSGWYMMKFNLDKKADKRYFLKLNRVELFSKVYLNGTPVGHHFGAYTPFEMEFTKLLKSGDNVLSIMVHDQSAALEGEKVYNQVGITRLGNYNPDKSKLPGGMHDTPVLEIRPKAFIKDIFVKTSTQKGEMEIAYELSPDVRFSTSSKINFTLLQWPNGEKVDLKIPSIPLKGISTGTHSVKVKWENPKLWSPDHPNLYVLRATLKNDKSTDVLDTRFGFREFWVDGKNFMLNGTPTRLRGESHYHNARDGVDFHREVFKMQKKVFGSNAVRVHAFMPPGDIMLGADEAGILLIDQSAIWSVNGRYYENGGDWFLKNIENEFKEWALRDRNSPSVVIWDVENEMLRFNAEHHFPWVSQLAGFIEEVDDTRPFNYSGAGWFDPNQDMVSLHMQEHYTRIMKDWKQQGTNPLIIGEFWVGGRSDQRLQNSAEFSSVHQRYLEEAKLYEEKFLEMRYLGVAGIMPFRISLLSFSQVPHSAKGYDFTPPNKLEVAKQPEDVLQAIRHGLQSATTFFWPRENFAVLGKSLKKELVVCNDTETENTYTLNWGWENEVGKSQLIKLKPSEQKRIPIALKVSEGTTKLTAALVQDNEVISADTISISSFQPSQLTSTKNIQVYKDEDLAKTLNNAGFNAISKNNIPAIADHVIWMIPEHANNREMNAIKPEIRRYLEEGGAILSLKQDQAPTWFPLKFQFASANQSALHTYAAMGWDGLNKDLFFSTLAPIYAKAHPVFNGLNTSSLQGWDEYDGRVADDVFARPSSNNNYQQGNWRPLSGGTRREHVSLAELFYGKGTLLACQLNIIENLENPQAKSLLVNMINYLSEKKAGKLHKKIGLSGNLGIADISDLTGSSKNAFSDTKSKTGEYLIASKDADIAVIKRWASQGGKVLVFSAEVSAKFEGLSLVSDKAKRYLATKVGEHHILNGVASANFIDRGSSMVKGYFDQLPDGARILLQGFSSNSTLWRAEEAGPVMVSVPYGDGELILATLEIGDDVASKELLGLILTNAGVEIPYSKEEKQEELKIKKTVPLNIDGNLNEWLEDMEDRLVTPYLHAEPVYITSESTVEGPQIFDLNLSAIDYFLWNKEALHIAGVVFMEKKFFGGEQYPGDKAYEQEIRYNDDVINIFVENNKVTVKVNGKAYAEVLAATGTINSEEMTDATQLQFNYIHASGQIKTMDALTGETFELKIPWELLKANPSNVSSKVLISLRSKDSKIQVPLNGDRNTKENWIRMNIQK